MHSTFAGIRYIHARMIPYRTPHVVLGLLVLGFAAAITTGVRAQQVQPGAANAPAAAAPVIPPRPNPSDVMKNWPVYPEALRQTGHQGTVLLQVRIDTQGVPREVTIARSSQVALLDQAAVLAVRQWRFSPATQSGRPVEATVRLPIDFRLKDALPDKPGLPAKPAVQKPKAASPKAQPKPRAVPQTPPRDPVAASSPAGERQGLERPPSLTLPAPQ